MADQNFVAATRIAAGDDRTRYDGFAIALHWITAVLVVLQFTLGETWDFAARPARHLMIVSHMSLGILLSAVVIVRIVWRLIPGHQVALPSLHLSRFRGGARLRVALVR